MDYRLTCLRQLYAVQYIGNCLLHGKYISESHIPVLEVYVTIFV